jgi:ketosteroid isomerase-like protein
MLKRIVRPLFGAALLLTLTFVAQARALDSAALETWLKKYGAAWESRDPVAAAALFTADASYHEMPFDPVKQGRAAIQDYWKSVTADQREIRFESKIIAVNGNTGVAHWKATFKLQSTGATIALDGVFVLEFSESGECRSLREWWHVKA